MPPRFTSRIFTIIYEDDFLLVIEKNAGFLSVPTERREDNTVVGTLTRYLSRPGRRATQAYVVHRLDRDTSGLMVWAKNRHTADALSRGFTETKTERHYLAIVHGRPHAAQGTLTSYLRTDRALNQRSVRGRTQAGDEKAVTHYQLETELRAASLLRLQLETGKRNQIRVQLSEAGHPLLGDQRYGIHSRNDTLGRLGLHATTLTLQHPETGERLKFESPLPRPMAEFVRKQRLRG